MLNLSKLIVYWYKMYSLQVYIVSLFLFFILHQSYMSHCPVEGTNWHVRSSTTQIRLSVFDGSSMGSQGSNFSLGRILRL